MDDGAPSLGVGFAIDTGSSFDELIRLQSMMDTTEMRVAAGAAKIEGATGGMVNLAGATAQVVAFGNAHSREVQSIVADRARVEKAGERMVAQLERQNATFGKTREELRAMRAEEAALAAERVGNADLAERLRAQEQALWGQEFAAARRAGQEAQAAAEDKSVAAQKAIEASEREAAAVREAAAAYQLFEAVAKQRGAAFRAQEADAARGAAEREAVAVREAAAAYQLFEAVAKQRGAAFRAQEADAARAAAEREAVAVRKAADEHARLVEMVRGSHDAQEADAAAAERLRASTDPLYAATKRLNAEIAESERLYRAGATPQAEYARQQDVLTGRVRALGAQHEEAAGHIWKSNFALRQTAIQIPDIVQGLLTGQHPMTIFIQQGGQIAQIGMMAEGGLKGFATQVGSLALRFVPLAAAAAVAGVAIYRWKEQISDDAAVKKFTEGLGLTHKELKRLGDTSVTTGDLLSGVWKTISDGFNLKGTGKRIIDYLFGPNDAQEVGGFIASIYGAFVGGYNGIIATWKLLPAAMRDLFVQAANGAIGPVNWLVNKVVDGVNALGGHLSHVDLAPLQNNFAGAASAAAGALTAEVKKATAQANGAIKGVFNTIAANTRAAHDDRLRKKADEIKADRTPKVDHHAEQLAREAAAIEAQIGNLYKLAAAYKVSDAAALIAEARVKAESQAIKQRGDIEAAVARQVRLAIAQRVSDAEKAVAAGREQAAAQEQVNALVAAGLAPAERAGELVRDRMADLPLLAAIEAAQLVKDAQGARAATKALEDQRAARERLTSAETEARYNAAKSAGNNRLDELREELRLIGATDQARARSLAELKAQQDLVSMPRLDPDEAAAYVKLQGDIAAQTVRNTLAQDAYNGSLTLTADRWDIIAGKVQSAASGMADAFGAAGRAIGDVASVYATFNASRERAETEHAAAIKKAGSNETLLAQENARFALRSSGAQIEAYGDMAAAAKGFFKEGSSGYKALAAAEKVYRIAQLAMSLQAMVQNALETTTHVASAGLRATADGTAGIAKQSQLPFPANIAAMAATAAALVAAGVAVFGGHGGGTGAADFAKSNTGTGTVLGDPSAKSESIKNAIDLLKSVDDATLTVSRGMLTSLRAIENNIGGLASLLVRTGRIDASDQVATGFKTNAIGSLLKGVPLIGGLLSSLFGTKTSVIGSGLYGGAQSVGDILSSGYDLNTYSDVEKKKKLFGITTGTKFSTVYGDADSGIEDQFTLVLRSFYGAIGKAAPELGRATSDVEQRLNGFVFSLGKIDIAGKTGDEIKELLENALGAAADQMAEAAIPGFEKFQRVGEGYFETLTRIATTVEQVDATFRKLGATTSSLGIDVDMAVANMFDSVSDFTSLADTYFSDFYTKGEQAAAATAQLTRALGDMGLRLPDTLAGYRALVEAQDLTTEAGRQTYVALLQMAPAFSDLKTSLEGAKSAADILSERQDLNTKLLQLTGDTAALRAAELAKLDPSNRALQQQIYAIQDAQDAAKAAADLKNAWASVGDSIMDEVRRIRGLTTPSAGGSFAQILGQFNATSSAARTGDQDAAKLLPGLSQSLLTAAASQATSRQELDRIQAQTAASLEATYGAITALTRGSTSGSALDAAAAASSSQDAAAAAANDDLKAEVISLKAAVEKLNGDLNSANAAIAGNTGRIAHKLDDVTQASGGTAISVAA